MKKNVLLIFALAVLWVLPFSLMFAGMIWWLMGHFAQSVTTLLAYQTMGCNME